MNVSNRPLDSFLLLQSGFIALAVLVVVLLEGCSAGIQSDVPLIANGERIESATGYWMLLSRERIGHPSFVTGLSRSSRPSSAARSEQQGLLT